MVVAVEAAVGSGAAASVPPPPPVTAAASAPMAVVGVAVSPPSLACWSLPCLSLSPLSLSLSPLSRPGCSRECSVECLRPKARCSSLWAAFRRSWGHGEGATGGGVQHSSRAVRHTSTGTLLAACRRGCG